MTLFPATWGAVSPVLEGESVEPSERALLSRARAGEVEALRSLYERHAPAVRRFLQGLLGDATAADDALQETFARGFRRLATLGELDRPGPWFFGIARNVAYELKRGRRRDGFGQVATPSGGACGEPAEGRTPEDELLGREAAKALGRALGQLSDDRRAALLLRVDHELAYDEIARMMGWSLSKAKVEVHRARLVLRAHLDGYEGENESGGGS